MNDRRNQHSPDVQEAIDSGGVNGARRTNVALEGGVPGVWCF